MARYYQVSPLFWTDPKVRTWDDATKLLAQYLLNGPHRNLEGLFRLPLTYVQADLDWPRGKVAKAMRRLEADGFVKRDADAEVVFICNSLRYQAPKSPKQVAGAVKALGEVPTSSVHNEFMEACEEHAPELFQALSNGVVS